VKKILGWVLVATLMVAIPLALATVIKDNMTYTGTVAMTGTETHSGAVTNSGVITHSDGVIFNDEVVLQPYKMTSVGSAADPALGTWAYANGNIGMFSGSTAYTLTLPTITAAMSGYVVTFKNEADAIARILASGTGDGIEDSQGTMTGTTEEDMDAVGDVLTLMAVHTTHLAGASSVWMIVASGIQ
jgi:hypothetical protein